MAAGPFLVRAGMDPAMVQSLTGVSDLDTVRVRSAPGWLRRLWIGPVQATTIMGTIYVAAQVLAGDGPALGRLLVHELVHVRQWRTAGPLRFLVRYLGDYLRGRLAGRNHAEAYRMIRYEVEARRVAGG